MEDDVREIILTVSAYILKLAGFGENIEKNKRMALENIENGKAYIKFKELVSKQYGDVNFLENIPRAKYCLEINAKKAGYVVRLDAEKCGKASLALGARKTQKRR